MDPVTMRLNETFAVGDKFQAADKNLKEAIALLGDDEIRWEMIAYLADRFTMVQARHDAIGTMANSKEHFHRDFIIAEMDDIADEWNALAKEIREKMEGLDEVPEA